jgi:thiamine pyrophosphokinase
VVGRAVVVIGGHPPDRRVRPLLPAGAYVIAADSGWDHATTLGLVPDLLVGDLDSISAAGLAAAEAAGTPITRYPTAKDATDTELALLAAVSQGAGHLTVVSGGGDRLDHLLGTLFALALPALRHVTVDAWVGTCHVALVPAGRRVTVAARAGEVLTLLPVGGPASGITTDGLAYPLRDEELTAGTSRGLSNVVARTPVTVAVGTGTVFVLRPEALP